MIRGTTTFLKEANGSTLSGLQEKGMFNLVKDMVQLGDFVFEDSHEGVWPIYKLPTYDLKTDTLPIREVLLVYFRYSIPSPPFKNK